MDWPVPQQRVLFALIVNDVLFSNLCNSIALSCLSLAIEVATGVALSHLLVFRGPPRLVDLVAPDNSGAFEDVVEPALDVRVLLGRNELLCLERLKKVFSSDWNIVFGMFWNILECFGMFWDVLECFGMFWNFLKNALNAVTLAPYKEPSTTLPYLVNFVLLCFLLAGKLRGRV